MSEPVFRGDMPGTPGANANAEKPAALEKRKVLSASEAIYEKDLEIDELTKNPRLNTALDGLKRFMTGAATAALFPAGVAYFHSGNDLLPLCLFAGVTGAPAAIEIGLKRTWNGVQRLREAITGKKATNLVYEVGQTKGY